MLNKGQERDTICGEPAEAFFVRSIKAWNFTNDLRTEVMVIEGLFFCCAKVSLGAAHP